MKALSSFEKSATTRSETRHHVPVNLNLYQRRIFGLKSADTRLYKRDPQTPTPAIVTTSARNEYLEPGVWKRRCTYVCRLLVMTVKGEAVE